MEVFFEVLREKTHVLVDLEEADTVSQIKQIIAGVIERPLSDIILKRPKNVELTVWETLDDKQVVRDLGYTPKTSKPDEPSILAFLLPEDQNEVRITPLSIPPPLPDAMQNNDMQVDN
ncbi:unnamed protein product [Bursaphelenchus okinawaensis]|uniref:Ubiquitin-like domain-containing protein n=1 Tax=Bursaphelenchus okinawaensis TaxID=465554 RepID=A0A811JX12_9BILA|nr:unnamed protein product [Bursaphelenchus okinawaensis]CAG9086636.1 unnamed protein product [Bursaphelenchus okinawaensis]